MSDPLKIYFKDIKKIPLLTAEEEVNFANRIKQGDKQAKDKMIRANLRLVISFAKKYRHFGIPFMDLIEEGNMGLMKAVLKFDPKKGFRFSTYASWWIRQYISRALANQGKIVRLPVYMVEAILKYKKTIERLTHRFGRRPSRQEIARRMKVPLKKIHKIDSFITEIASLETPVGEGQTSQVQDLIEDEAAAAPDYLLSEFMAREKIEELLKQKDMTERERHIVQLRYGLINEGLKNALIQKLCLSQEPLRKRANFTLEEIAKFLGITRERVRQIEGAALNKLRKIVQKEEKALLKGPCRRFL